jgi:hypothetical protein
LKTKIFSFIILFIIISVTLFGVVPDVYASTVETRHFCGTSWDATYYKLLTAQSGTAKQYGASGGTKIGIRVFKRSSGGVSTEITSGTPVAVATYTADGMHSATWNCLGASLLSTDAVEVRVYFYTTKWLSAFAYFKTEQLNGQSLDASTWTVYYYLTKVSGTLTFYWDGDSTHDSRITNFTWTPVVSKSWNAAETWRLNIYTLKWFSTESWRTNAYTLKWFNAESWKINLHNFAWFTSEIWRINAHNYSWFMTEIWQIGLHAFSWVNAELWMASLHNYSWFATEVWKTDLHVLNWFASELWKINLHNYSWFNIETWKLNLHTLAWYPSEIWNLSLHGYEWFTVEIWQPSLHTLNWFTTETWKIAARAFGWISAEVWQAVLHTIGWYPAEMWLIELSLSIIDYMAFALGSLGFFLSFIPLLGDDEKTKALGTAALILCISGLAFSMLYFDYALPIASLGLILALASMGLASTKKD